MGTEFAELPHWEFTIVETVPGNYYRVRATRDGGITGEGTGADLDHVLDDLRHWAQGVDLDMQRTGAPTAEP